MVYARGKISSENWGDEWLDCSIKVILGVDCVAEYMKMIADLFNIILMDNKPYWF